MGRKTQLYLFEQQRNIYKNQLSEIKQFLFDRILPAFDNAEKEATEYGEQVWEELMCQSIYDDTFCPDPSDFVESAQAASFQRYELITNMQYRTLALWISCLCQMWEQQLYSFVIQEAKNNHIKYSEKDIKRGFSFTKEVFAYYNMPIDSISSWPKICELRLIVNVIKHSEGDSSEKLRKNRPDLFSCDSIIGNFDKLKLYNSTLLGPTLNITRQDFSDYLDALTTFWNELPERMISTAEI